MIGGRVNDHPPDAAAPLTRTTRATAIELAVNTVLAMLDRSGNPARPWSRNLRHHRHAGVRETPISAATCTTA